MFSFRTFGKACVTVSGVLTLTAIILIIFPGPTFSIEFTGGSFLELQLPEKFTKEDVIMAMRKMNDGNVSFDNVSISATREKTFLLRLRTLSSEEHSALLEHLKKEFGTIVELQFTTIGPTVGSSMAKRAFSALILALIGIVLYIAIAFRNIPAKYSPWKFGVTAVISLIHVVLLTIGIFVILSHTTSFEFDTLFVTALLTIIGYAVNDTIVIFDRLRDNLSSQHRTETFEVVASRSLIQSLTRSLNTGVATFIMLICLFFLGPANIQWFILALIIGFAIGTYSSIGLATPLLVYWRGRQE
ncbi:protein-export membrane protein SecF [Candidatus Peribacteria bacterium RIFCSPHIGHO2_01_FULL_51_9]|nr:MAG: protein-export membrane protein SecF [Candidatus Peribacteria bacterium RIFCSPHIGHO2_01_FULL_51_9]